MPRFLQLLILLSVILCGCIGNNGNSPVTPIEPELQTNLSDGRSLLGYWQCAYDTNTGEIEFFPARTSQLHVNLVSVFNTNPGMSFVIDHLQSNPAIGMMVLTVSLTHPWPGMNNFSGFDVRGILITTAGLTVDGLKLAGPNDPELLNPDGYTRWWNPTEFPTPGLFGYVPGIYGKPSPPGSPLVSQINPYKQFANGLTATEEVYNLATISLTADNGRGVFRSGTKNSREYRIKFPVEAGTPKIYFNYAIDASWKAPSVNPPEVPDSFPPDANSDELWFMDVTVTENTLHYDGPTGSGGSIKLSINAWDWQGWMNNYDNQIGAIRVISPDCTFSDGVTPSVSPTGNGNAILTATINGTPSKSGDILIWIGVIAPGTTYKQTAALAPNETIVAWKRMKINVTSNIKDGPSDFYIHAWIVRDSQGNNPAITENYVNGDVNWANTFYKKWADGTVSLVTISYINRTAWLSLTINEAEQMFSQFKDTSGPLNIYYVNDTPDAEGAAAYTIMECLYEDNHYDSSYVILNDYADSATLAHEMGHAIGLLEDDYFLDWYTCEEIENAFCGPGIWDTYCNPSDAVEGNLMYWPLGENVNSYFLSDNDKQMVTKPINSQVENIMYYHTHYPDAFSPP